MREPDLEEHRANPHGRRKSDHLKWWVLVVSALLQGGFAMAHRWTLQAWERQVSAERELRRQQHNDMMSLYRQNHDDIQDVSQQFAAALKVLNEQAGENTRVQPRRFVAKPVQP